MALMLGEHTVESLAFLLKQKGFQDEILDCLRGMVVAFLIFLYLDRNCSFPRANLQGLQYMSTNLGLAPPYSSTIVELWIKQGSSCCGIFAVDVSVLNSFLSQSASRYFNVCILRAFWARVFGVGFLRGKTYSRWLPNISEYKNWYELQKET